MIRLYPTRGNLKNLLLLLGIIFIAAFLRFYDINWDQGQHLHPDERFLTMVTNAMQLPHSFDEYLYQDTSTFNPANINYSFFVYGLLPLSLIKVLALIFSHDTYEAIPLIGRGVSALCDVFVVILIYKISNFFERRLSFSSSVKFIAAFFYAVSVLPIQLSHFFTVDTFLNFFLIFSLYLSLRFYETKKTYLLIPSAFFFGCAVASKISALYIFPLIAAILVLSIFSNVFIKEKSQWLKKSHIKLLIRTLGVFLFYGSISYLVLRITDPYIFQHKSIINPLPSQLFINNLKTLQSYITREIGFPPGVQWINKTPVLFSLINLSVFGIGIPFAILILVGLFRFLRTKNIISLAVGLWCIVFFLYQSLQIVQTMRYFLPLYPFFSLFAAVGFCDVTKKRHVLIKAIIILAVLIWPLFFFSIYTKPHSRVTASEWIYQHIPPGRLLLAEHWDDALPLPIERYAMSSYKIEQLPVFDPDTDAKWTTMNTLLTNGDYLVLSSNRGWGSITTVPDKYPRMSKFYNDLFAGKLQYKKVAEFTSYPSLQYLYIPLTFPDDWSEEAFTVYDHPKVMIFKKVDNNKF